MKLKDFFAKIQGSPEHEVAITAAQVQIAALEKERDDFKAELATVKASLVAKEGELSAANKTATDAQAEVVAVKAQALKDLEAAKATIKTQVAQQALEITGQQVSAPVPAESKAGAGEIVEQFAAIKDSKAKAEFFVKHEATLRAAAMKN